jgi:hypothetical protein
MCRMGRKRNEKDTITVCCTQKPPAERVCDQPVPGAAFTCVKRDVVDSVKNSSFPRGDSQPNLILYRGE